VPDGRLGGRNHRQGRRAVEAAGDTLMVVSAMKMETAVTAPCAGVRRRDRARSSVGGAGRRRPDRRHHRAVAGRRCAAPRAHGEDSWAPMLAEVQSAAGHRPRRFAPDSTDPGVVRQRARGKLTCRERIDLLLDPGSFREVGSLAGFASYDDDGRIADFTPANHVGGWGRSTGAPPSSAPTTSPRAAATPTARSGPRAATSTGCRWSSNVPRSACSTAPPAAAASRRWCRSSRAAGESVAKESSGAITAGRPRVAGGGGSFLPGHLGSSMFAEQLGKVPVVNLLLGSVVGIGAAKAVLGHFSVMVRDIAQLFVAGPPVVSHAMGYDITKEDLGDWRIHCRNGSVDNLAETEAEAVAQARRFLSYLPSSVYEAPPALAPDPADPIDRREEELFASCRASAPPPSTSAAPSPDGRQGLVLRDRPAVGHRPGHRLRPLRRPSGGRHRLRQPARQRRRADRRRLRQAAPPPRRLRPLPPADPEPVDSPASPSASSTRSPAPSARAASG
jgi:hypothetical protein